MASNPDLRSRRAILVAVAAVLTLTIALAACGSSDGGDPEGSAGGTSSKVQGIQRATPLEVGSASLPQVDPDGTTKPFAFKAPEGDLLFVAFGYTNCPDVCPTTLSDIRTAKRNLGEDGDRVSVAFATVDPTRDTAKVMNEYLGSFVDGGHPLRTTDAGELKAAQDAFEVTSQVVEQPDGEVEVSHSARSFVVDDHGQVVVEWAFGTGPKTMASDLRILLDDSGA